MIILLQENERLKEWNNDLLKENIELENIRKEAIEYINFYTERLLNCDIAITPLETEHLLNILQNGSDHV